MIVVDTSALMEIVLDAPRAEWARQALASASRIVLSGGTLTEALIVAAGRQVGMEMARMIDGLAPEVVPVDAAEAQRAAAAYLRWGKGYHPARLNFGDCFAYALARRLACPLLYVGDDFARTDVLAWTA